MSRGMLSQHRHDPLTGRIGLCSAVTTAVATAAALTLALFAIPISGANCPGDCATYPYLDTLAQYPRDFVWMLVAMIAVLSYLVLAISLHRWTEGPRRAFSEIGLVLAAISAAILVTDYYLQFSVVPMSLRASETEGLALLIQYNPHGVFLALEELGYLLMSLSFLFIGAGLPRRNRLENAARWVFLVGFGLSLLSLLASSSRYGMERLDRFEVAILSIDWMVLMVNGILLSLVFHRSLRAATPGSH